MPKDILKTLHEFSLKTVQDEVWFILDRFNVETGTSDLICDKEPIKDLPLYINGNRGKVNQILAKVLLEGKTDRDIPFSEEVLNKMIPVMKKAVKNNGIPGVVEFAQGKLYHAGCVLKVIGDSRWNIANRWATIQL